MHHTPEANAVVWAHKCLSWPIKYAVKSSSLMRPSSLLSACWNIICTLLCAIDSKELRPGGLNRVLPQIHCSCIKCSGKNIFELTAKYRSSVHSSAKTRWLFCCGPGPGSLDLEEENATDEQQHFHLPRDCPESPMHLDEDNAKDGQQHFHLPGGYSCKQQMIEAWCSAGVDIGGGGRPPQAPPPLPPR